MTVHSLSTGFRFSVAVFADSASRSVLVCLDEDKSERGAADAVAQGYKFAGTIAVLDGVPKVEIQPGFEVAVTGAGLRFAELLGTRLQRHQLAVQAATEKAVR